MSAPQTNIEKQKRRHRGPLVGMALGVVFIGVIILWMSGIADDVVQVPEGTEPGTAAPSTATTGD